MLRRILKLAMAQGAGVGITLLTQLLLPPIFLHSYGILLYGEWLVLSATISYLSTLNFGITTYASNELTILRQQGNFDRYRNLQASTLALMLAIIALGVLISGGVALLPLVSWLHLRAIAPHEARLIVFFLGLQMTAHILGGYYNNLFMVVQETHRGTMWYNYRRLAAVVIAALLALLHRSFAAIAFGQFAAVLLVALATIVDLRTRLKGLPLGLRGATWATAKSTLKPSGMFGMVFAQTMLVFQAPLILLQTLLGPEIVVVFTICRTVLATARQLLSVITTSISPEITFSFGSGDTKKLLDIFHYSEKVVFFLVPAANLGTLLLAPILLRIWLHRPDLFELGTYVLMACVSGIMSVREHKQYFQYSTNTHYGLAYIVFWGNIAMIAASIPMTLRFGIHGFMITWLSSEATQTALLYRENRKLFLGDPSITLRPTLKLATLFAAFLVPCSLLVSYSSHHSMAMQAAVAAGGILVVGVSSWLVFQVRLVQDKIIARVTRA